jgi:hypothetical protein
MDEIAARIDAFLAEYGKRSADDGKEWSSPDASELEACSTVLKSGKFPSRYPWSEWGSGGYGPYTSKQGRREHDDILKVLGNIIEAKPDNP